MKTKDKTIPGPPPRLVVTRDETLRQVWPYHPGSKRVRDDVRYLGRSKRRYLNKGEFLRVWVASAINTEEESNHAKSNQSPTSQNIGKLILGKRGLISGDLNWSGGICLHPGSKIGPRTFWITLLLYKFFFRPPTRPGWLESGGFWRRFML